MLKHKFSGKRRAYIVTMRTLMTLAALLTAALVLFMIGYVLYKGLFQLSGKVHIFKKLENLGERRAAKRPCFKSFGGSSRLRRR